MRDVKETGSEDKIWPTFLQILRTLRSREEDFINVLFLALMLALCLSPFQTTSASFALCPTGSVRSPFVHLPPWLQAATNWVHPALPAFERLGMLHATVQKRSP